MLKTDVIWPNSRRFKSRTEWEPIGFFSEALCNATQFDLKLGFFSSSAINVLADGFATYLYNGGKVRLIINDILSTEDKQAMLVAESNADVEYFDLHELADMRYILSKRNRHFFECLAWLIRHDRIEIKVVAPKSGEGIAHSKCGIFSDGINRVAFDGSCNFSKTALISNIESITAFCDWDGQGDVYKIQDVSDEFERTFTGKDDSVIYLEADYIRTGIVNNTSDKTIAELLEDEKDLIDGRLHDEELPKTVTSFLTRAKNKVNGILEKIKKCQSSLITRIEPCFPYPQGPRDYQKLAFENWKANKQKGLFAMATGTGKTITSLNCLLEIYKRFGYYKAIILVPTITLVRQWEEECFKFHFDNVLKVYSKNPNWKTDIEGIRFQERFQGSGNKLSYIIISTYASFVKSTIFEQLADFPKNKVLLIADEAHNMGANNFKKILPKIPFLRKIGLSATPNRQFDDTGNKSISNFFDIKLKEYTFEYSMAEAIENDVLCRYFYYPHIVKLTDQEMNNYIELSIKIAKYFSINKESFVDKDPILTALLLKRKRIIHKAANKLDVFKNILQQRIKENGSLKFTLVYVPEGNKLDDEDADKYTYSDEIRDDEVSEHLIDIYSQAICDIDSHVTVKKFTSDSSDREITLRDFAEGKLEVLTSMKCLDEGIDVPRSELAIFCASTGNPRQFIQRRGRILRQHKEKKFAIIHDLIVTPEVNSNIESFLMERSLLKGELKRVNNFALLSENPSYTCLALNEIMSHYGLSLFNNNIE